MHSYSIFRTFMITLPQHIDFTLIRSLIATLSIAAKTFKLAFKLTPFSLNA